MTRVTHSRIEAEESGRRYWLARGFNMGKDHLLNFTEPFLCSASKLAIKSSAKSLIGILACPDASLLIFQIKLFPLLPVGSLQFNGKRYCQFFSRGGNGCAAHLSPSPGHFIETVSI